MVVSDIRRLRNDEIVQVGDLVTIGVDEESGFRRISGCIGFCASDVSYPVYRDCFDYKTKCEQLQKERDELRELVKNVYLDIHISELTQTRKSVIKLWRSGQEYYAELTAHRGKV